jgi:hypothetical protein
MVRTEIKEELFMDAFIHACHKALFILMGTPGTFLEEMALLGVSFFACTLAADKMARAFGAANGGFFRGLLVTVPAFILIIAAIGAGLLYLVPYLGADSLHWIPWVILTLISLIVIVPMMCLSRKMNFISAFISWSLTLIALAIVIMALGGLFNAIRAGGQSARQEKNRTRELERFLGNPP